MIALPLILSLMSSVGLGVGLAVLASETLSAALRLSGVATPSSGAVAHTLVGFSLSTARSSGPAVGYRLPIDRAIAYQLQLATDPDFRDVLVSQRVSEPLWAPDSLLLPYPRPRLWWRIIPVDRDGFSGVPSAVRELRWPVGLRAEPSAG